MIFHVLDQENDRIEGVTISMEFEDPPTPHVEETDEDGIVEISREAGEWLVTIVPPAGFSVSKEQNNPFKVRIRRLKTSEFVLRLEDETPEGE